jgi:hypothetical protein
MAKRTIGGTTKGTTKNTAGETKARRAPGRRKTDKTAAEAPIAMASDSAVPEPLPVAEAATVSAGSRKVRRPIDTAGLNPEDVRRRAYELYVNRGYSNGSDIEDWLEAERQLRSRTH